ncbi:MAG: hypothetical protein ACLFPL_02245 [Candidatus Nanoarchaeia archaeon]
MKKNNLFFFSCNKRAQSLLFSYLFYLFLSLTIFSATFLYSQDISNNLERSNSKFEFQTNNLEYVGLFLQVFEQPNSQIDFNTTQTFTNSEVVLRTDNHISSFETSNFAYFYQHQAPFCDNYSVVLENIDYIEYDSGLNCINIERKISIFD